MGVSIRDAISVPASSTVENVIAQNTGAQRYIRPPFNAIGRLMANINTAGLRCELVVNGMTVVDDTDLRVNAASVLDPLVDTINPRFFIGEGQQLVLRSVNPSAGAKQLRYQIDLEETEEMVSNLLISQRGPISIAAGGKVQLLAGFKYERPRVDSLLSVFASVSAGGLLLSVYIDGVNAFPPTPVQDSNRVPQNPGDLLISGLEAPQGKMIELLVENPTGGALSVNWRTELEEMG